MLPFIGYNQAMAYYYFQAILWNLAALETTGEAVVRGLRTPLQASTRPLQSCRVETSRLGNNSWQCTSGTANCANSVTYIVPKIGFSDSILEILSRKNGLCCQQRVWPPHSPKRFLSQRRSLLKKFKVVWPMLRDILADIFNNRTRNLG